MDADGLPIPISFGKIVSFQHACEVILRTQFDDFIGKHILHPAAVKLDACFLRVQRFENLSLIGLGVSQNLVFAQNLSRFRNTGRVTDHAGKIPDQEDDLMPKFLKMTQLLDQHDMAKVKVGCGGIEPGLYPQGSPLLERNPDPILELTVLYHLNGAARDKIKLPSQFSI